MNPDDNAFIIALKPVNCPFCGRYTQRVDYQGIERRVEPCILRDHPIDGSRAVFAAHVCSGKPASPK